MKAIIHIGTPKAGSTTIQTFLERNRAALSAQGFHHERLLTHNVAQLELGLAGIIRAGELVTAPHKRHALRAQTAAEQHALTDRLEAMRRDGAQTWPEGTWIASSEQVHSWLSTRPRVAALHGFLSGIFSEVRYIVYYRPQEEFILSSYSERIRRGESLTLEAHLRERMGRMDYHRRAVMWAEVVGRANLSVRLLDRSALVNGDLLDDFCAAAGIDRTGLETPPRMNPSLSAEEAALRLRLARRVSPRRADGSPNPLFVQALWGLRWFLPRPGTPLRLTDTQRAQIRAASAPANESLRAAFFPERATLFGTA